jgi:hypothetical protein
VQQRPLVDHEALRPVGQSHATGARRQVTFEADAGRKTREEQAAWRQHTPHLQQHRRKRPLVACEVENGAADDCVG